MAEEENGKGNKERKSMKNRGQGFNSTGVACNTCDMQAVDVSQDSSLNSFQNMLYAFFISC
jgi:hypothetical protein